jgi:hypothetical protein
MYFVFCLAIGETLLFVAWKVFRQKWPGVVLWRDQNA